MPTRQFADFPANEKQELEAVFQHLGLALDEFEISDTNGTSARQVTVRRQRTGAESVYDASPGAAWVEEIESDLECGLFGRVSA
ncbi:MAG: hypothetical protein CL858_11185 [Cupriavidus sp.]|jgi:hypothetical protein|uniref:hypothetical protein n=1 Tax=Cupriavidus pauculus TaxID=82633 RepID=UPI000785270A|nr:hypothetical protein [Cupriavidus pauculus]MBU66004.1 hypothetical protein [Cupriavidus sp.]KAB0603437.1 hypothetical protein F7R19_07975 [Cupriavidus pauculus]MBY4732059.1 hypothetical protein [Cupriavidus pauculus]MCM3605847.1 hypothetical protein [Cupriavidus pauculus]UAL02195.1 hypothetical protein K8O84_25765 [Cupriavidus pauculus]